MGKKIPIDVGVLHFDSKKEATDHYREILNKYKIGERIEGQDATDVEALFGLHREREHKAGSGIDYFSTMIAEEGSKCFAVIRVDGGKSGFSLHRCINQNWD